MLPQELKALEITACKIRMDILTATPAAACPQRISLPIFIFTNCV